MRLQIKDGYLLVSWVKEGTLLIVKHVVGMEKLNQPGQPPIDPVVRDFYEENPYDPVASARMLGRFLGALVTYHRKMSPVVAAGSFLVGLGVLIPAIVSGNVLGITLGVLILQNVLRNFRRYYF